MSEAAKTNATGSDFAPSGVAKTEGEFQPYIPAERSDVAEFTPKAIGIGVLFGIIFGAATVYLALKAGLTVSASIPIAVLAISLLKKLGGSTILENNVVQTIGSAGESIAAGVVFTLPGFLFLSADSKGSSFFEYWTIFTLAHRQGARQPALPRGHGVRLGAHRR